MCHSVNYKKDKIVKSNRTFEGFSCLIDGDMIFSLIEHTSTGRLVNGTPRSARVCTKW